MASHGSPPLSAAVVVSWCHCAHAAFRLAATSSRASFSAAISASSRRSCTVCGHGAGRPAVAMCSCIIRVPAALAPLSWCITTLSSWIARSTAPCPVSALVVPVRLMARMPG